MKKRTSSLAFKLHIFIVAVIMIVSLLLLLFCNFAFRSAVFEPYEEKLEAVEIPEEDLKPYLEYFATFFGSEEFKAVRDYAHNDDAESFALWMESQPSFRQDAARGEDSLFFDWVTFVTQVGMIRENRDLDAVCVEIECSGTVYRICEIEKAEENYHSFFNFGSKVQYVRASAENYVSPKLARTADKSELLRCITVPLKGGQARFWVSYYMTEYTAHHRGFLLMSLLYILLLTAAASLIAIHIVRHKVTRPIQILADAAKNFTPEEDGSYSADKVSTFIASSDDEIAELSRDVRAMQESIVEDTGNLTRMTAERERISTELGLAKQIQAGMLPSVFPPFPEKTQFDLFATMTPAREVGGDFYDFFLVDEDHLALVIADVSGKGVPGALFMAITKAILKNSVVLGRPVGESLEIINKLICANNKLEMFVTIWLGVMEISTGKITAANAGHEYPVVSRNGRFELLKDTHSFVIGGMEDVHYKEYELQLEKGDTLFLYTDGIPEAVNTEETMFGTDRMLETLNANAGADPEKLIGAVSQAVTEFVGEADQYDDQTMLCLVYKG